MSKNIIKVLTYILFALYIAILIKIVLLKYNSISSILSGNIGSFHSYNFIPFKILLDFKPIILSGNWNSFLWGFANILGNIVIFIPLGLLLPTLFKKFRENYILILLTIIGVSVLFESLQYLLYLGTCDIDDVILNTTGGFIGILIYRIINKLTKKDFIMQCLVLGIIFVISIPSFYVARTQFGTMLGLINHTVETVGDESIPNSDPDVFGTLINIDKDNIDYYKGFLSNNEISNKALEKDKSIISKDTKLFMLSTKEESSKSTLNYSELSMENLNEIEKDSSIKIWLKPDGKTANVIVFSEPFNAEGLTMDSNNSQSSKEKKEEVSGTILEVFEDNITINLQITNDKGMAISGVGKNAVKFNVRLTDKTTYKKIISKDNGKTSSNEKATKSDLALEQNVSINGKMDGDNFIANSVIIYIFE